MLGCLSGPEAKAIVMFARKNDTLAAGTVKRFADSVGVESGGIENGWIFVAVSPFAVGEGVYREVQEVVVFQLAPC
jgi:hypothetical protein